MMIKNYILILLLAVTGSAYAQGNNADEKLRLYSSFAYSNPVQNLSNYQYGFGVYSNIDYNFSKFLALRIDIGWNDFSGPEKEYVDQNGFVHVDHPNMSVWEFTAGMRLGNTIYAEGRAGYYTGINSWGAVPAVGFKVWKLDFQVGYTFTFADDKQWAVARVGYYF